MRRPKWMTQDLFAQFVGRWNPLGGFWKCNWHGGCDTEADTVDHIVPLWEGGTNTLSNFQPMCRSHNSSKGARPDGYWSRTFYWDRAIDLSKLRVAQSDFIYNVIVGDDVAEFFARPISEISGRLFAFLQIVGAGKTLGKFIIPFAVNRAIRAKNPNAPRCDKLLIVTKGQALRRQIVKELETEPVEFGIVSEPPRVREITEGSSFLGDDDYDVAVMCPNLLWPDVDVDNDSESVISEHKKSIIEGDVLRKHPIKAFDEFHYAFLKILAQAEKDIGSLYFVMSASPVETEGSVLKQPVRVSCYGYDPAARNDGSMKYLSKERCDDIIGTGCVNIITAKKQEINGKWIDNRDDAGNKLIEAVDGLATVKAVADGVVRAMHTLDTFDGLREISPHRRLYLPGSVALASVDYPPHGIITVKDAKTAEDIAIYLNEVFSRNRARFPLKMGWKAVAVHGKASEKLNRSLKPNEHPFFYFSERGKIDAACCRIVVVVDMAVEGMNNKYVNIIGVAQYVGSVKELIQRIGRALRSTHIRLHANGAIGVPCAQFDKVHLITHEAFTSSDNATGEVTSTEKTIDEAIEFILNMEGATAQLDDILTYIHSDDVGEATQADADANLGRFERFNILYDLGRTKRAGRNPRASRIVRDFAGNGSNIRKDHVRAYVKSAVDGIKSAYKCVEGGEVKEVDVNAYEDFVENVLRLRLPQARDRVLDDERSYIRQLSVAELEQWLATRKELGELRKLKDILNNIDQWKDIVQGVYKEMTGSYGEVSMAEGMRTPLQEVHAIIEGLKQSLLISMRAKASIDQTVERVVNEAVLHYLAVTGLRDIKQLGHDGTHNRTGITHVLREKPFIEELRGYLIARMLQEDPDNPIFDLMPQLRDLDFFRTQMEPSPLWEDLQDWDAGRQI